MKKLEIDQVVVERSGDEASQLESSLTSVKNREAMPVPSVMIGRVAALPESGIPLVDFPGNISGKLVPARTLVPITPAEAGRKVALSFEDGDTALPIIVGVLQNPETIQSTAREIALDKESLVLSAKKEVVIQCGKSSLILTSAGKVLIRGAYLLSRSSGVNRIKGGSVQIN